MRTFDLATGEVVWQYELPAASGAPISYTPDGEQYITVVAGGQGAIQSRYSTRVVSFKLPKLIHRARFARRAHPRPKSGLDKSTTPR